MKKVLAFLFPVLLLSACETTGGYETNYQAMSCYDLTKKIGMYESKLDDARMDSIAGTIDSVFGNKSERAEGEIDEFIADMDVDNIKTRLETLKRIRSQKGCS